MMSAHQMTSDLETLTFDQSQKVMPQIEELTQNVAYGNHTFIILHRTIFFAGCITVILPDMFVFVYKMF